jgi:phosphoribosylformylglycinamidine cyclo-ligase
VTGAGGSGATDPGGLTLRGAGVSRTLAEELLDRVLPAVRGTDVDRIVLDVPPFAAAVRVGDLALVATTDGVGTKRALMRHRMSDLGQDLVAINVNDVAALGVAPLLFLDYVSCGRLGLDWATDLLTGMAAACRTTGCVLLGGETAEHPGIQGPEELDLAGFAVGVAPPDRLVTGRRCEPGDVVVGLASAGPHASGFSLIRHAYAQAGRPVPEAFLAPTPLYCTAVADACARFDVHALANICDGGLTENVVRGMPEHLGVRIWPDAWPRPTWVTALLELGCVESELRASVNVGIGYVIVIGPGEAEALIAAVGARGMPGRRIGEVVPAQADRVRYG